MARRINAPGIEVNEIDRSGYEETVDNSTIGTATMVLGFADKGDDYTVRWMNTMNTFIKTYGQPTNDAERYFYNTVFEILSRGGVCYSAKLPYYNDSKDNFVYTSYTIDQAATPMPTPREIVDGIRQDGVDFWLSDYTSLEPQISSMCTSITAAVNVISSFEEHAEEILGRYSQLSDGFVDWEQKTMDDLATAVGEIGDYVHGIGEYDGPKKDDAQTISYYYSQLEDDLNRHIVASTDCDLMEYLFYPYLIKDIQQYVTSADATFTLKPLEDFIEYVKSACNLGFDDQFTLERSILSSPRDRRMATLVFQDIMNGSSKLFEDETLSSTAENIRLALTETFGGRYGIKSIVDGFTEHMYLWQFNEYFHQVSSVPEMHSDIITCFNQELTDLYEKYTEPAAVDPSLTSYAEIKADVSARNETMSFDNYDSFLVKQLRVPLNKIYIVDQTRGKYDVDTFGNQVIGIMPVIVSPANALFYQDIIRKSDQLLSDYNVIGKVRNSYRTVMDSQLDETLRPFDQTSSVVSSYTSAFNQFAGLGDYLGSEVTMSQDGRDVISRVTINDYTVSQYAAEHFPTMKFVAGRLDRKYLNQIGVVVFKLFRDTANENRISFAPVESFVGSLDRTARDETTGERIFLDDVINSSSDYINFFSNAAIPEGKDSNPLGLKNASIYLIQNQTACSMGFYERDTRKNIHVSESIYKPMLRIFERSEDRNTLDVDIVVDGGVSNIAQFIASTQVYQRDPVTDAKTGKTVQDEFQRYGKFDLNDELAYLFKLESQRQTNVWSKVIQRFDDFAKNTRKDLIFLADGPRPFCLEGDSKIIRRSRPDNTIKKTILPKMKFISGIFNSSYSAGYLNWFWSLDHSTGTYMWMPPSIKALGVYLYTDNMGAYWDAPAGLNRGKVSNTLDVAFNPTNEEAGQIYINSWNYAVSYPLDGIVLEGQRTFQVDKTALDRVNVRRLMLGLEKTVRNFCKYFNYEGNTAFNRARLQDSIERYLEQVRFNDGISQYIVVCDERNNNEQTIDNNELHIAIAVRPVKTIEFIVLNFIATNQSVDVEEAITAELGG